MRHLIIGLSVFATLILNPVQAAGTAAGLSLSEHQCYALSMIGYDHVINASVGLPIEDAVRAMRVNEEAPGVHQVYKDNVIKIVAEAYSWGGNPHDYAVKVLFRCAQQQPPSDIDILLNGQIKTTLDTHNDDVVAVQ